MTICWLSDPKEYSKVAIGKTTDMKSHKGLLTRSDFKPHLPLDCIHLVAYYINNDKIIYVSIHEDLNTKQSSRLFRKSHLIKFYI